MSNTPTERGSLDDRIARLFDALQEYAAAVSQPTGALPHRCVVYESGGPSLGERHSFRVYVNSELVAEVETAPLARAAHRAWALVQEWVCARLGTPLTTPRGWPGEPDR